MQFNATGIITANANFNKFLVLIKVTELFKEHNHKPLGRKQNRKFEEKGPEEVGRHD